ncbi:MAG: hypothetical protein AAGI71_10895 [Bacteroidota bacterium]
MANPSMPSDPRWPLDDDAFEALAADALFGTLTPEDEALLTAALAADPDRAEMLRQLRATLTLTAQRTAPAPPAEVFDGLADRLVQALDEPPAPATDPVCPPVPRIRRRWWERLAEQLRLLTAPAPTWTWQLGLAVVLIGIGVALGRWGAPPELVLDPNTRGVGPNLALEPGREASEQGLQPAVLEREAQREALHVMDRSKVLLLGLVNLEADDVGALDMDRKQALARDLVHEARRISTNLEATDQQRLRVLIDDLERILLQIANLEATYDLPSLTLVQSSVDQQGLLLKINLTQMRYQTNNEQALKVRNEK